MEGKDVHTHPPDVQRLTLDSDVTTGDVKMVFEFLSYQHPTPGNTRVRSGPVDSSHLLLPTTRHHPPSDPLSFSDEVHDQ